MRIGIASHVVLDTIKGADGKQSESIGGPACYCGITARQFGFDVDLATRAGKDFPLDKRNFLLEHKIAIKSEQFVDSPTTRFSLAAEGDSRRLVLQSKCDPISANEIKEMKVDCWLVSPVIDEVPLDVLAAIKQNKGKKNFLMLDPQGYMRLVDSAGQVSFRDRLDFDMGGITAIKVDRQEMAALTGGLQGLEGMRHLQSKGVEFVLATEHRIIHLLHKNMHYWIKMRDIDTSDSTGAGDILCAGFACAYLKEKDALWGLCFGAGAVRAALETKEVGLAKIPQISKIENSASYYYNTVSFQKL